jgi:hypothetical protein
VTVRAGPSDDAAHAKSTDTHGAVCRYGQAAYDYNGSWSRNIPEGARVSIDVCLYGDGQSRLYCNEDEGVA